jgi:hypothetical protein
MNLKQRHIVMFSRIKSLKLGEIAKELSNVHGPDASIPPSIKYWLHQIKLGRTDLRTQRAGRRPPLNDVDAKFYHSFKNIYSFQYRRLLSPWRFQLQQFVLI